MSEDQCRVKDRTGYVPVCNGEAQVEKIRPVQIEDLLGREPVRIDLDAVINYVKNKVVLVTGGGGSIGSELCRQVAANHPKMLIIFDIYENNAYEIQQELKREYPSLHLEVLIGQCAIQAVLIRFLRITDRISYIMRRPTSMCR